jgi:hypothetical protein
VASTLREPHEEYVRNATSLLLRLNPSETDPVREKQNSDFLATFKNLREAFNAGDFKKATEQCKTLREKSLPVLKSEWERVKRGERVYRVSKFIATSTLLLGLIGTSILAARWESGHPLLEKVSNPTNPPSQPPR